MRLKSVEPVGIPMGDDISSELNICNLASEQGAKRACEQVVDQIKQSKLMMKYGLSTQNYKLKAEMMGPYTVVAVNQEFKTCWVQDKT